MKETQMLTNWRMDTHNVVYLHNGIFGYKKKQILIYATTRMTLENIMLNEKSKPHEDYIL